MTETITPPTETITSPNEVFVAVAQFIRAAKEFNGIYPKKDDQRKVEEQEKDAVAQFEASISITKAVLETLDRPLLITLIMDLAVEFDNSDEISLLKEALLS